MFIDTHAHLTAPEFEGETERVIERALQAGIDYMIIPGTDIDSSVRALEMADKYEYIYAAVGVHPHDFVFNAVFQNNNFDNDKYNFGFEYGFNNFFFLRAGYQYAPDNTSDENTYGVTAGAGIKYNLGGLNYT